jgi:branched-chain amino acid transport system substrate-binding protein
MLAGAELPLVARGAKLSGRHPSDGIEGPVVGGRRVKLTIGCADTQTTMLAEARRLVELDRVDVVVGPLGPTAGLALREYARRQPEVTFVAGPSAAPELTRSDPAPNVFRFFADTAQSTAGLGSYAFRELGWRRAAIVGWDHPFEWAQAAGFVAEFCALGGTVDRRLWTTGDESSLAAAVPRTVDGVFVAGGLGAPERFLSRYATLRAPLAQHVVVSGAAWVRRGMADRLGARLDGVVSGFSLPFELTPAERAYVASFREAFPTLPGEAATSILVLPYALAVEATLEALEQNGGAVGRPLQARLAALELRSPLGLIRLDPNRQAIAANFLSRFESTRRKLVLRTLRVVPAVDASFGGYFRPTSPPPTRRLPVCQPGPVPAWARR